MHVALWVICSTLDYIGIYACSTGLYVVHWIILGYMHVALWVICSTLDYIGLYIQVALGYM